MTASLEQILAVEEKARVDDATVRSILAGVPPSWKLVKHLPAGAAFTRAGVQVLFTVQRYQDPRDGSWPVWLHASACGRTTDGGFRLPEWNEFKRVKADFIGSDRWAYQVFPDEKHYINQNPYVLHLYALLDRAAESALPDFTWGLGTI